MNEALARIHFPNNDNSEEIYFEKVFRIKQYYFQNNPIPRVAQQKIKELITIQVAFDWCFPNAHIERFPKVNFPSNFVEDFAQSFSQIYQLRASYKREMAKSNHAFDLADYLENWYNDELNYAKVFGQIFQNSDFSKVNLSQQIDPMSVLELMPIVDFSTPENLPQIIQNELMRCSKFVDLAK